MRPDADHWRLPALCSEAVRRSLASPVRASLLAAASGVLFAVMLLSELIVVEDIESFRREQMWQGRGILVAETGFANEQPLLRTACTALASHSGVAAAGGLRHPRQQSLASYPGVGTRLAGLDEAAWGIWFPDSAVPLEGVAAGSQLAARVGMLEGDALRLEAMPDRLLRVGSVLGDGRPFAPAANWLIEPLAVHDGIDQCWVEFDEPVEAEHTAHLEASLAGLFQPQVRPVIRDSALTRDPSGEFAGRWSQWGPAGAIGLLALLYVMILHSRKGEQAVYVTVGLTRAEAYLMSLTEVALTVIVPGIVCSALALQWHNAGGHPHYPLVHRLAVDTQLLTLGAVLLLLPLLAALQPRQSLLDDLKSQ